MPYEATERTAGRETVLRTDEAERLRVAGAGEGAMILGIARSRFTRLARAGCLHPAGFYVNRYHTVVWLYLVEELHAFARARPRLLTGRTPPDLRALVDSGVDHRPRHWRSRRISRLVEQASGPWERAAARASVLGPEDLAEAVPDPEERARLRELAPEPVRWGDTGEAVRRIRRALSFATDADEVLWYRTMLAADLQEARRAEKEDAVLETPVPQEPPAGRKLARDGAKPRRAVRRPRPGARASGGRGVPRRSRRVSSAS